MYTPLEMKQNDKKAIEACATRSIWVIRNEKNNGRKINKFFIHCCTLNKRRYSLTIEGVFDLLFKVIAIFYHLIVGIRDTLNQN
jgi:hypothetical protein